MKTNDIGLVLMVLIIGFLLGIFAALGVYAPIAEKKNQEASEEAKAALEQMKQERDEAYAKIVDYLQREKQARDSMEQGVGADTQPPEPLTPGAPLVQPIPREVPPTKDGAPLVQPIPRDPPTTKDTKTPGAAAPTKPTESPEKPR